MAARPSRSNALRECPLSLLACHFTSSYRAAHATAALGAARAEAERLHGPLARSPFLVTDHGASFLARTFRRHIDGDSAHECKPPGQGKYHAAGPCHGAQCRECRPKRCEGHGQEAGTGTT